MKKAVFVSTTFPYPVDYGKKLVVRGILEYLIERYGADHVTFVLLGTAKDTLFSTTGFPCRFTTLEIPAASTRLLNVLWFAMIKKSKSIQELMLYSPDLGRKLRAIVADIDPDLVLCDTFRAGQFFETPARTAAKFVLYMDDLFSVRYQRILDVMQQFPRAQIDLLGNFAHSVPALVRPLANVDLVRKWLLRMERELVEKREGDCVKWFDTSLLINEDEAELLKHKTGNLSIHSIKPLLMDVENRAQRRYTGEPVFVFLGALNLPHNHLSIVHFIRTQMDEIVEKIPGVRLRVIGRGASAELTKLAEHYEGSLTIEGFVQNLDAVFSNSCAMIVPLLMGSGLKIKTLEALSRGLPVISTDLGVEGIPVVNGVNCLVENELHRYSQLMSEMTNVDQNRTISYNAREFYFRNYSRGRVREEYNLLLGKV